VGFPSVDAYKDFGTYLRKWLCLHFLSLEFQPKFSIESIGTLTAMATLVFRIHFGQGTSPIISQDIPNDPQHLIISRLAWKWFVS
jgi:hypothetical protein